MENVILNFIINENMSFGNPVLMKEERWQEILLSGLLDNAKMDAYEIDETYDLINIITTKEEFNEILSCIRGED